MTNFSEIYSDGEKYISSKRASALTGYAKDYIGQLCRLGKIKCQRSGRDWLVSEQSILNYKEGVALNNNLNRHIPSYDAKYIEPSRQIYAISRESRLNELGIKSLTIIFEFILVLGLIIGNPAGALTALHEASNVAQNILNPTHILNSTALASLPSLPFTWEDSKLAVLDLKNKFLDNLFSWKDYLASFGRDIKIIAQDFLSLKSTEVTETPPPDLLKEGSKIITFGEATSTPPPTPSLLRRGDTTPESPPLQGQGGEGVVSNILIRLASLESKLSSPQNLDQKLSSLNQAILAQVQLSLSQLEKRLPSNQVQNPVVFLTTQIPGPQQAGGGSPPQTGSGVSASFGDFSNGISTGGNLTASGNITLGQDTKTAEITSSTWKITSAGAASGLTGLTSTSINTGQITASSLNVSSIVSTGNVGIGTTSPGALLGVAGTGLFSFLASEGFITTSYLTATSSATSTIPKLLINNVPTLAHTFSTWATGNVSSSYPDASLVINPSSATADSNLFSLAVGSSVKALIDAEGDLFIRNITAEGSVTQGATTLASLSVENASTFGDAIGDTVTFNAGSLTFNNQSTTTIPTLTINAFSFATSTTAVPFLSFDTKNYRIGLGTTTPGATFSVAGSGFFNSALTVNGLTTLGYASTTGVTASQYFQAGGAGGLNVFSSGLTGIGTTSPSQLLSVQGNGLFSGNLSAANLTATGTVTFSNALAVSSGGTGLASFTAGDIIYASSPTAFSKVSSSTDGFILSLTNGKPIWVATSTFTANGPLTVTSSGSTFVFNASSSPFFGTLFASSTVRFSNYLSMGLLTTDSLGQLISTSSPSFGFFTATSTTATSTFSGGLAVNGTGFVVNQGVAANSFNINSSGNVGIGTTSPAQLLSVHGNGLFSGNLSAANITATGTLLMNAFPYTSLAASTEKNDVNLNLARTVQFAAGDLATQRAVLVQAPTYAFTASSTLTDASTFLITGAPKSGTFATSTNLYALKIDAGSVLSSGGIQPTTAYGLYISAPTGASSNFGGVIATGSFGVGTTSPSSLFSVQGNGLFSGNLSSANLTATGTVTFSNALTVANGGTGLSSYTSGDILYAQTPTIFAKIASSTDGFILSLTNGKPIWVATSTFSANGPLAITSTGSTFSFNASSSPFFGTLFASSTIRFSNLGAGAVSASSLGVLSSGTLSIANGGTNATAFTTSGNGVYYDGTSLLTAPLGSAITIPYASTTAISSSQGATFATVSGNVGIGTTNPGAALEVISSPSVAETQGRFTSNSGTNVLYGGLQARNSAGNVTYLTTGDASYPSATYYAKAGWGTLAGSGGVGLRFGTNSVGDRMVIDTSGNVGIGTAGPSDRLVVKSQNANATTFTIKNRDDNNSSIEMGSGGGGANVGEIMLYNSGVIGTDIGGSGINKFGGHIYPLTDASFDLGQSTTLLRWRNVFASGCTGSQCTDVAEYYTATESLEAGDLVSLNATTTKGVKKASAGEAMPLLGIISSTPGVSLAEGTGAVLGQQGVSIGVHKDNEVPVALAGRVPVKVSLEGGAIAVGDKITSSSVAGVGMKATASGMTVEIALENFDGTIATTTGDVASYTGKILVFVNLGYSRLDGALTNADFTQTNGWIVDQTTGRIKASYTLDMDGHDIVNTRNILSVNGAWSINESGLVVVDVLETRKGVTTYDMANGQPFCIRVLNAQVSALSGKCSDLPINAGLASSPPPPPPDTSTTTISANTSTTTATTTSAI